MKKHLDAIKAWCDIEGECWIWRGRMKDNRKPVMCIGTETVPVRRVAWELAAGQEVPTGKIVAAKCANPRCVAPGCAVATTPKGKAAIYGPAGSYSAPDRIIRSTLAMRAMSKISDDDVRDIRFGGEPSMVVAKKYGISKTHVNRIRTGEVRRDLTNPFAGMFSGLLR